MTAFILMRLGTGLTIVLVALMVVFALFCLAIPAIAKAAAEDRAERMRKAWDEIQEARDRHE